MFDWGYIFSVLSAAGGLSALIARFIVQFFFVNHVAVAVTAILLCLVSLLVYKIIDTDSKKVLFKSIVSTIPSVLLMACLVDNYLHYDALVALIIALVALLAFRMVKSYRVLVGSVIAFALYLVAGSASLIFAVSALALELTSSKSVRSVAFVALPAVSLVCAFAAFHKGDIPTFSYGITPEFFYELTSPLPGFFNIAWFSVPAAILLASLGSILKKELIPAIVAAACLAAGVYFAFVKELQILKAGNAVIYKYEYLVQNEKWKDLEKAAVRNIGRYEDANYYNLAKSKQGKLGDELLDHVQPGAFSLIYIPDIQSADMRLAYVLYEMGNLSAAENVAFNALRSLNGFKPSMVKICADVEIARGKMDVARKYNNLLSKSLHYRAWAKSRAEIIEGEKPLESIPELARGASVIPNENGFVIAPSPIDDLYRILDTNPTDRKAFEYTLGLLTLSKDFNAVYECVKKYYTDGNLPVSAQEALVFFWDYYKNADRVLLVVRGTDVDKLSEYQSVGKDWLLSHGVEPRTFSRFESFKEAYAKANGPTVEVERKSFWFYRLFVNVEADK